MRSPKPPPQPRNREAKGPGISLSLRLSHLEDGLCPIKELQEDDQHQQQPHLTQEDRVGPVREQGQQERLLGGKKIGTEALDTGP